MNGLFKEMATFSKYLEDCLSDDEYKDLQQELLKNPEAGAVITGTGGLRKVRWVLPGKGKSGGVRIIYYWYTGIGQFWMFTIYKKGEMSTLTGAQKKVF